MLYGLSDEDMYDQRVIAADNVKSIKFPRMARWMAGSFHAHTWNQLRIAKMIESGGLTLSQVFSLAANDTSGKILDVVDEADELKAWALQKASLWGKPIASLMIDMRTVDLGAPDLVQRVRVGVGSHGVKGVLTQARLQTIVEHLPGEWDLQRQFVEMTIKFNITAKDLDILLGVFGLYIDADDHESMEKLLENPNSILHPTPRQDIVPRKELFELPPSPTHADFRRISPDHELGRRPVTMAGAFRAVSILLLEALKQHAFSLTVSQNEHITFNLLSYTVTKGTSEIVLTFPEARMFLALFAIQRGSSKRITGKGFTRWFFTDQETRALTWESVFTLLQAKLAQVSPALSDRLQQIDDHSMILLGENR